MLTELAIADILPQGRQVYPTEDEVKALAESIQNEGLRHPIVVSDGAVLDGLKRIKAYISLDLKKIQAVVSDDFEEICLALESARGGEVLTILRQTELLDSLSLLRETKIKEGKQRAGRARMGTFKGGVKVTVRPIPDLLVGAIGGTRARLEILSTAIRISKFDPEAREKLQEVKDDKLGVYAFQRWNLGRQREDLTPIASVEEVRLVMERGLRALTTTVDMMSKFGSASVLTLLEREQVASQVHKQGRALMNLARLIRKDINQEVEEQ